MSVYWNNFVSPKVNSSKNLDSIKSYLAKPCVSEAMITHENERTYPSSIVRELNKLGLADILANHADDPFAERSHPECTLFHLADLCYSMTQISGSLAISVGVNLLGALPIWLAGSEEQKTNLANAFHDNKFCSLGLTEVQVGSDLVNVELSASPNSLDTKYKLNGQKDIINGGARHQIITVLGKIDGEISNNPSLFTMERDSTVASPIRWLNSPMPAADISSIRFNNSLGELVGRKGRGLETVISTLAITRGFIGLGGHSTASSCWELSTTYAQDRKRRGKPIMDLNPISDHLLDLKCHQIVSGALAIKTTTFLNAYGPASIMLASAAKYLACCLGEEAVIAAEMVHSAQGVMTDTEIFRLSRDAKLYGLFDGTKHVVLDQLSIRLEQMLASPETDTPEAYRDLVLSAFTAKPNSLTNFGKMRSTPILIKPSIYMDGLSQYSLVVDSQAITELLNEVQSGFSNLHRAGKWQEDQSIRLHFARIYTWVEGLMACLEMSSMEWRRAVGWEKFKAEDENILLYEFSVYYVCRTIASLCLQMPSDNNNLYFLHNKFNAEMQNSRLRILADRYALLTK